MYEIRIDYKTGNSFGSQERHDSVGCVWTDLEEAKDALRRITEHNKHFDEKESYSFRRNPKVLSTGDWFSGGSDKWDDGEYSLFVIVNGEKKKISAFWRGYFEILLCAEIVVDDSDMKYIP